MVRTCCIVRRRKYWHYQACLGPRMFRELSLVTVMVPQLIHNVNIWCRGQQETGLLHRLQQPNTTYCPIFRLRENTKNTVIKNPPKNPAVSTHRVWRPRVFWWNVSTPLTIGTIYSPLQTGFCSMEMDSVIPCTWRESAQVHLQPIGCRTSPSSANRMQRKPIFSQ